jgi:PKD repeat protein
VRDTKSDLLEMYIDGVLDGSVADPIDEQVPFDGAVFGMNASFVMFAGKLDDDRIYKRALEASEIASIAHGDVPASHPGNGYTTDEGTSLSMSASQAGGAAPFQYEWQFGDGGSSSGGLDVSHVYADNGSYTAKVKVTDAKGRISTAEAPVTVNNLPPTANAGGPYYSDVAQPISFSATATDPGAVDSGTLSFVWTFGDGQNGSGKDVSHTYSAKGNYAVTLRVTDKDGASATASATANVGGPQISLSDKTGNEGTAISYTAGVTGASPPYTYSWDFGDSATSNTASPSHSYGDDGSYTVRVTVTDSSNLQGTASARVSVNNVNPIVTAGGPYVASAQTIITFVPSVTDPGSADTIAGFTYNWSFGDGATSTLQSPAHAYAANGNYTVSLTVTDKDGGAATSTVKIADPTTSPQILPTYLAFTKQKAQSNTAEWQTYKAGLDAGLGQILSRGAYQGSDLTSIADYALGYRLLKDSEGYERTTTPTRRLRS